MPEMAEDDVLQKKKSHRDRHSGIWPYSFPIRLFAYINLSFFFFIVGSSGCVIFKFVKHGI
jgi:hypothetical protein